MEVEHFDYERYGTDCYNLATELQSLKMSMVRKLPSDHHQSLIFCVQAMEFAIENELVDIQQGSGSEMTEIYEFGKTSILFLWDL